MADPLLSGDQQSSTVATDLVVNLIGISGAQMGCLPYYNARHTAAASTPKCLARSGYKARPYLHTGDAVLQTLGYENNPNASSHTGIMPTLTLRIIRDHRGSQGAQEIVNDHTGLQRITRDHKEFQGIARDSDKAYCLVFRLTGTDFSSMLLLQVCGVCSAGSRRQTSRGAAHSAAQGVEAKADKERR
eukprot:scaffold56865_cov17-Tisochrysis_lutea.AAC.1